MAVDRDRTTADSAEMFQASLDAINAIWPCLAVMALVVAIASARAFCRLDPPLTHVRHRDVTIDALRTFLAFSVFFHHLSNRRHIVAAASGSPLPASHFYTYLGSLGVAVFFMITGYLFWGKLLDSKGRPRWSELYLHRFFRIVPLYWFLIITYTVATVWRSGLGVGEAMAQSGPQLAKWFAFGAYPPPGPLLGDMFTLGMVGMTWTLSYEWFFYASLLLTAIIAPWKYSGTALVALLIGTFLMRHSIAEPIAYCVALFIAGMLVARAVRLYPALSGDGPGRSTVALLLLAGAICMSDSAYTVVSVFLLGPFFYLVASGTSIFGILKFRGAVRLGHASYSTYLLHGLVLSVFFAPSLIESWHALPTMMFWPVAAVISLVLVVVSALGYVFIEMPGIRLGRHVVSALRSRRGEEAPENNLAG